MKYEVDFKVVYNLTLFVEAKDTDQAITRAETLASSIPDNVEVEMLRDGALSGYRLVTLSLDETKAHYCQEVKP